MAGEILIRCEGGGDAAFLENIVLGLSAKFSEQGVVVAREFEKSLEFGSVKKQLFITIIGAVAAGLILMVVENLLKKENEIQNVNIVINIKDSNIIFNLPEEKEKILHYLKSKNE